MNLAEAFSPSLIDRESDDAVEFQGAVFTFGQIERASNRLARQLADDGLAAGDRLCVYLENSVELIELYLAAVKLGLIFVPINVLYRARELEHILADAEPGAIVTSSGLEEHLSPVLGASAADVTVYRAAELHSMAGDQADGRPPCPASADTPAALVYTSGTTGRSKGAVLTHANFAANARNLIECWEITCEDRLLLPLPLFHVHGLGNGLHTWLMAGYRMRLLDRFRKETIAAEFLDFRPTVFFGVPTMYERLLEIPADLARRIGESMRLFVSGSAPLPPHTLERFRDLYGHDILERYGMTETMMNISNPYRGERRPGSVGKPLPGVSIRLADPETGEAAAPGTSGEILIRGPNVFAGYWRQPEATRDAFTEDGYFRSGDLASRAEDGYYTLEGRGSELIICGGFNIYPREIEEFLCEQPGVAEAAVVGTPDKLRGQAPIAYIVCIAGKSGVSPSAEGLAACCAQSLASFKVPRRFLFVEKLPRNALGKLQRHLLPRKDPAG